MFVCVFVKEVGGITEAPPASSEVLLHQEAPPLLIAEQSSGPGSKLVTVASCRCVEESYHTDSTVWETFLY